MVKIREGAIATAHRQSVAKRTKDTIADIHLQPGRADRRIYVPE